MASGPYFDPVRGTWKVQYYDGTKWKRVVVVRRFGYWKPGDPPPKKVPPRAIEMLAYYSKLEEQYKLGKSDTPEQQIEAFLVNYREAYWQMGRAQSSLVGLDRSIKWFLKFCNERGIRTVKQVTSEMCEEYGVWRSTYYKAAWYTISQEKGLLGGAWNDAIRAKKLEGSNPWHGVRTPGAPPIPNSTSWTPEEFSRLLEVSNPWLRRVLILAVNTGIRISALIALTWEDIAFGTDGGQVIVRPNLDKIGRGYRVPMSKACRELLEEMYKDRSESHVYVLSGHNGRPIRSSGHTADCILAAIDRADLKKTRSPNHALRRTFGRWAVLGHLTGRPIPLYVVSRWMGHTNVGQTERYLQLSEDSSANWMADFTASMTPEANAQFEQTYTSLLDATIESEAPAEREEEESTPRRSRRKVSGG